jgi:hypothetical protein
MSTKATCGKHTTLASNSSVRVTRCGCGMLHLTVVASGVTVQMKEETLRGLGAGVAAALEGLDQTTAVGSVIN